MIKTIFFCLLSNASKDKRDGMCKVITKIEYKEDTIVSSILAIKSAEIYI